MHLLLGLQGAHRINIVRELSRRHRGLADGNRRERYFRLATGAKQQHRKNDKSALLIRH